jgi:hypothetical protein
MLSQPGSAQEEKENGKAEGEHLHPLGTADSILKALDLQGHLLSPPCQGQDVGRLSE